VVERRRRGALHRREVARRLDEVVVRSGAAHGSAQVADRRARLGHERAQDAQERRKVLGRRLGLRDEHVEVVERRPQVHERRIGAPQRRRQQPERLRERDVLGADRARRRVRVADEAREVIALLAQRRDQPRRVDEEAREAVLVLGQLADEPARRRQQRVEVLDRLGCLAAPAAVLGREALDDVPQPTARPLVQRVEELVEVHDRGRRRGRQRGPVVELLRVAGRRRQCDVAVGDAGQRGEPDRGLGALAQRRIGLLHADLHRRLVVLGELDALDRADTPPTDLDVVVGH
jgi:hypothetical protein